MPKKSVASEFLEAMERHGLRTIPGDFRGKFRPRSGGTFNGTAYRILLDNGTVQPPLDNIMSADDILERDSLYGIFELAHKGYMGFAQKPQQPGMDMNHGDAFRFEITDIEDFPTKPFHHLFIAKPRLKLDSPPDSVMYQASRGSEERTTESAEFAETKRREEEVRRNAKI